MGQLFKPLIIGVFALMLLVGLVFMFSSDEYNVRQSQELNTILESSNVGSLRASFEEDSDGSYGIQASHALNELKLEIADRFSGIPNVKLDYMFFDKDENTYTLAQAENRDDIIGMQFKITALDSEGTEISTTTERRVLDKKE